MDSTTPTAPITEHLNPGQIPDTSPLVPETAWPDTPAPEPGYMTEAQKAIMANQGAFWEDLEAKGRAAALDHAAKEYIEKLTGTTHPLDVSISDSTGREVVDDPTASPAYTQPDAPWSTASGIELSDQILALQIQLPTVSSCLAAASSSTPLTALTAPSPNLDPSSTLTTSNLIKELNLSPLVEQNRTAWTTYRHAELEKENMILRRAIKIQGSNLARIQEDQVQMKEFTPNSMKQFRGVDPQPIADLASELVCGSRIAGDVASAMFDLVERADWRKEDSHSLVRLVSVEAVLDVTLGRVAALEGKVKESDEMHVKDGRMEADNEKATSELDSQFTFNEDDMAVEYDNYDSGDEDGSTEDKESMTNRPKSSKVEQEDRGTDMKAPEAEGNGKNSENKDEATMATEMAGGSTSVKRGGDGLEISGI